jgi:quinoprotein glucose dehydrogenase
MRGSWAAIILAIVMAIIGIVLAVGGIWLAVLGGSIYYLVAGVAMIASAWFLFRGRLIGGWIYVGLFILSAIWGFAESRGNAWAMVPWLVAPLVILIWTLLVMPTLTPREGRSWGAAWGGIAVAIIFVVASFAILGTTGGTPVAALPAQQSPGMNDPSGLAVGADWPRWGGTEAAWRYSPLDQINVGNVGRLQKVWETHVGGLPAGTKFAKGFGSENTPIKVGDLLYACNPQDQIIAMDAATGRPVWRVDPKVPENWVPYTAACRSLAYYAVPGAAANSPCAGRIIEGTIDSRLIEVDALTGKPCTEFNGSGQQDTKIGMGAVPPGYASITSPPAIVRGNIVVGHEILDNEYRNAPSGVIEAFDARTGKLAWAWDMDHPDWSGYPPKGQEWARGTPNMWTAPVADEKMGLVYIPTGNRADDYISSIRTPAENKFTASIVALDATSGKPRWSFQAVRKDVWDYDFGSQPSLIDYHGTPALLAPSKQGDLYVLDRATGRPLTPIGTVKAPIGGVEPDQRSPIQIVSLWNTLRKPDLTESDMWGMSPIDQMICRIEFREASYQGYFTPPTHDRHYIEYPSYNGGSDWGSVSIDPVRGIAIANYNDMPNYNRLLSRDEANRMQIFPRFYRNGGKAEAKQSNPQWGVPYAIEIDAGWQLPFTGLMCKRPPYGGIRAIDIGTGKTLWDHPFGTARRNGPFGIPSMLPFTIGTPNNGGAVTTAGGLVFIAAATDNLIRAIDIATGKTVWTASLPAGGQATPVVYQQDGREYLVIYASGHHFMHTPSGDSVIAYALPRNA